jgi:hypothetical protein
MDSFYVRYSEEMSSDDVKFDKRSSFILTVNSLVEIANSV